jgi:ABC-type branched-subunit amino acid transport system permease subunit
VLGFATLTDVHWTMSGLVILMTLVGGLGTLSAHRRRHRGRGAGEQAGRHRCLAGLVTSIDWFNTLGDSVTIVTGLIFIVCVLAFRKGIGRDPGLGREGAGQGSH